MVREIVHDPMFLQRKSEDATQADLQTAQDLLDTLRANFDRCVGMAANMIGVAKKIIAVNDNGKYLVMFNPEIISKFGEFETEEGCLSLDGERKTVRYKTIKVKYFNENFKQIKRSFSDFTAQIIQHEIDHCNGSSDLKLIQIPSLPDQSHGTMCGCRVLFCTKVLLQFIHCN